MYSHVTLYKTQFIIELGVLKGVTLFRLSFKVREFQFSFIYMKLKLYSKPKMQQNFSIKVLLKHGNKNVHKRNKVQ